MVQDSKQHVQASARPFLKLLIELGPLVAFFLVYSRAGIYWATGVLMVATVLSLVASRTIFGRLLAMPVVTAVLVVVFGGLTFWLDDPRFIKIKPTIINLLFAGVLIGGLITRRPLLKMLFGEAFNLTEEGWRKLTRALDPVLPGSRRSQRGRLAQLLRSGLGEFQGIRHPASDARIRHGADRPDQAP